MLCWHIQCQDAREFEIKVNILSKMTKIKNSIMFFIDLTFMDLKVLSS